MTQGLPTHLETAHGHISYPAYVPVTTFGKKYPLDDLVRPYLRRLAPAAMVSLYYARQMEERPNLPLMIDSGGFASLFKNAALREVRGLGVLELQTEVGIENLHPREVLEFQEEHADIAFTLDFPIPPSMDKDEAKRRLDLTIKNALWAAENMRRRDLKLFGCVQGWDVGSYRQCAEAVAGAPFEGLAIGGLVPRMRDRDQLFAIVDAVRKAAGDRALHVFGIGRPDLVAELFQRGVQSVDSSAYVKSAADGKLWGAKGPAMRDASPVERLHLAICNLAFATGASLPLSSASVAFRTAALAKDAW